MALTAMSGAATVIAASSFGTTIFHRGMGERIRLARVRSSISLANAAAAILLHELRGRLARAASAPPCDGAPGALRFGTPASEEEREPCLASRAG